MPGAPKPIKISVSLVCLLTLSIIVSSCSGGDQFSFVQKPTTERFDRMGAGLKSRIIFLVDSSLSMGPIYPEIKQNFPAFVQNFLSTTAPDPRKILFDTCISFFPLDYFMNHPIYGPDSIPDSELDIIDPLCTIDPSTGRRLSNQDISEQFNFKLDLALKKLKGSFVTRALQSWLWIIQSMYRAQNFKYLGKNSVRYYLLFTDSADISSPKPLPKHTFRDFWPISSYFKLLDSKKMPGRFNPSPSKFSLPASGYAYFDVIGAVEDPKNVPGYKKATSQEMKAAIDLAHREYDEVSSNAKTKYALHVIAPKNDDTVPQLRKMGFCEGYKPPSNSNPTPRYEWNEVNSIGLADPFEKNPFISKPEKLLTIVEALKVDQNNELGAFSKSEDICDFDAGNSLSHVGDSLSQLNNFVTLKWIPDLSKPIHVKFFDRQSNIITEFSINSSNNYGAFSATERRKLEFDRSFLQTHSPSSSSIEYFREIGAMP